MIDKPKWWNAQDISNILMSLCIPEFEDSQTDDVERFLQDLRFISEHTLINELYLK